MAYININNPANYQLQEFGQMGFRVIDSDHLNVDGETYRTIYVVQDAVVTALTAKGDDITSKALLAGTLLHGLFSDVSVTSGKVLVYMAGRLSASEILALYNAYLIAEGAVIEGSDCVESELNSLTTDTYADASLVLIPSGYDTGVLYGERPLDSRSQLDFTRASNASRIGPDGLIEKVRTNLLTYSEDMITDKVASNTTVTNNFTTAPNGTLTAARLENTTLNSFLRTITLIGSPTYSCYVKYESNQFIQMICSGSVNDYVNFDIQNGIVGNAGSTTLNAKIESVGNGWFRCSAFFNSGNAGDMRLYMVNSLTAGFVSASVPIGSVYYTWGWQAEYGDIATDYIPTTTAAVSVGPVANLPRLNYPINADGSVGCPSLLLEPQRTNLVTYSEQFDNAAWTKQTGITVMANTTETLDPSGYYGADKIVSTNGTTGFFQAGLSLTSDITRTIYLKGAVGGEQVKFKDPSGFGGISSYTLTTSWERYEHKTTNTGDTYQGLFIDDISNGATIYAWGAQLEAGSYATSYIPTYGTSATVLSDNCVKTSASSIIGQTKGVVYFDLDFRRLTNAGIRNFCSLEGSVSSQFSGFSLATTNNGNDIFAAGATYNLSEGRHKVAYLYDSTANVSKLFVDGALRGTSTFSAFLATIDRVSVGARVNPYAGMALDRHQNGEFSSFLLFPDTLSNEELATLTTL